MSSQWKFWGAGKKGKGDAPTAGADGKKTGEAATPSSGRDKVDRNMSISRSGRHKYRSKQRCSVLRDDLYDDDANSKPGTTSAAATAATAAATAAAAASPDGRQGGAKCHTWEAERDSLTRLRGALAMASQPTAV